MFTGSGELPGPAAWDRRCLWLPRTSCIICAISNVPSGSNSMLFRYRPAAASKACPYPTGISVRQNQRVRRVVVAQTVGGLQNHRIRSPGRRRDRVGRHRGAPNRVDGQLPQPAAPRELGLLHSETTPEEPVDNPFREQHWQSEVCQLVGNRCVACFRFACRERGFDGCRHLLRR